MITSCPLAIILQQLRYLRYARLVSTLKTPEQAVTLYALAQDLRALCEKRATEGRLHDDASPVLMELAANRGTSRSHPSYRVVRRAGCVRRLRRSALPVVAIAVGNSRAVDRLHQGNSVAKGTEK